ncbi:MAG TPA: hypothetical protein PL009_10255 [Flavipsychrobacter sp.]|nr:hypothetical protein [Flavipsychrobacter sp.]
MNLSLKDHVELTPQHYENLVATGYKYMEFIEYLETPEAVGMLLVLYKPIRLKTDGQELIEIDDPMILNLVYSNSSIAIFIQKDY